MPGPLVFDPAQPSGAPTAATPADLLTTAQVSGLAALVSRAGIALVPNDTTLATATANTAALQAVLNLGGRIAIETPGSYCFNVSADPNVTFLLPSNTSITIGAGVQFVRPSGVGQAWFSNANYATPRKKVSAIGIAYVALNATTAYVTYTVPAGHGLVAGGYALVKGEGSNVFNGILDVLSVTATSVTTMFSGVTTGGLPATGSLANCYLWNANAYISVLGAGSLDNAYIGGASGMQQSGLVFNKVKGLTTEVASIRNLKYSVWTANIWNADYSAKNSPNTTSDGIHLCGPLANAKIHDWGANGGSGDDTIIVANDDAPMGGITTRFTMTDSDTVAITSTANNGSGLIRYTATAHGYDTNNYVLHSGVAGSTNANQNYQVTVIDANTYDAVGSTYDSNGTGGTAAFASSGGDVDGVVVTAINTERTPARSLLLWSSRSYKLRGIVLRGQSKSNRSLGSGVTNIQVVAQVPTGQTGSVELRMDDVRYAGGGTSIFTVNGDPVAGAAQATLNLDLSINGLRIKGENGFSTGQTANIVTLVSQSGPTTLLLPTPVITLTDTRVEADVSGASNAALVDVGPCTKAKVNFNGVSANVVGTNKTFYLITGEATCSGGIECVVSNIDMGGTGQIALASFANTGVTSITGGQIKMSGGAGQLVNGNGPSTLNINLMGVVNLGTMSGMLSLTTATIYDICIHGLHSPGSNVITTCNAGATVRIGGFSGNVGNFCSVTATARFFLKGSIGASATMNADYLAASGHLGGSMIYNSNATPNATSQGMGFPAATAIGLYAFGATAFTRLAS